MGGAQNLFTKDEIESLMKEKNVPGLSLAIIERGRGHCI